MRYFVVKLPLKTDDCNCYKVLKSKFEAARVFYNAMLAECKRRKANYLCCDNYKNGVDLLKAGNKDEAQIYFSAAKIESGFYLRSAKKFGKNNSIEQFSAKVRNKSWLEKHIDVNACHNLCKRAFNAVKTHKKTYFKKYNKDFITSLGNENKTIKLKDNKVIWPCCRGKKPLVIPINFNERDIKHKFVLENPDKVRYVKITREWIKNKWNYYADVTCEGNPPIKPGQILGTGRIGIDVGPSKVNYYTENSVKGVIDFAKKLDFKQKQIRVLQRKLNRQQMANNPDNYDEKGRIKPGSKKWIVSKREAKTLEKLREIKRKEKAHRRCLHGQAANFLRMLGDNLRLEKCNYKQWQQDKRLSKSITKRAPGLFVEIVRNKFLRTGGKVHDINTYKTKLSQTCPFCRKVKKKPPYYHKNGRIHSCECGFTGDRDDVAALLALCVTDTDEVNFDEAKMYSLREMPTLADRVDGGIQTAK